MNQRAVTVQSVTDKGTQETGVLGHTYCGPKGQADVPQAQRHGVHGVATAVCVGSLVWAAGRQIGATNGGAALCEKSQWFPHPLKFVLPA